MPRAAMDYSKTSIYKIVCNDLTIKDCYVGHTIDMTKRKWGHKTACNNEKDKKHNLKIYKIIRENGGWDNWNMVLVEKFPCKDKYEACKREREVYEELDAQMNTFRPHRTHEERKEYEKQYIKQYREEHKEELKEYKKQYREENKEKLKQICKQYREEHKAELKQYREENKEKLKQMQKKYNQEHKAEFKQYREEHKEDRKEYNKQYREENKEKLKQICKQYREEHKAEIAEKRKEKIECKYCSKRLSKGNMSIHLKICKSKQ